MHQKQVVFRGAPLNENGKVLVMLHGRGASAEDILSLADHLEVDHFTLVAPQATNNTWYPYSFMAPTNANEPWLSSAIALVNEIVKDILEAKVSKENIYFLGFSQGACLTLEYVARNADRYGGIIAFTGGLIGEKLDAESYWGDFQKTPIFIGSSEPDPHVPSARVKESTAILKSLNAQVTEKIYFNMGHTINEDELGFAKKVLKHG